MDPIGDMPDSLVVNGHHFVHVAACPCERIQAEVARLTAEAHDRADQAIEDFLDGKPTNPAYDLECGG